MSILKVTGPEAYTTLLDHNLSDVQISNMLKSGKLLAIMQNGQLYYVMPMEGIDHTLFIEGTPVGSKFMTNDKTKLLNAALDETLRGPDVTPNAGVE